MRFASFLVSVVLMLLAACSGSEEELASLEARIVELERQVQGEDAYANSATSRDLQEASAASDEASTGGEDPQQSVLLAAEIALSGAAFLGLDDSEFGGTTIRQDEEDVAIRHFRAGLEDRSLSLALLDDLGFGEAVGQRIRDLQSEGEAASDDGTYALEWTASAEELVLRISPT